MTYFGLLIAGFVGMLVFWTLALWVWATRGPAASHGMKPGRHKESKAQDPAPAPQQASAIPMQFRRLQSGAMALLARQRASHSDAESRVRRNCMFVDAVEPEAASTQLPEAQGDDEGEIERRATGIFFVQADSPRPRDAHAGQDLATQPYKRARHQIRQAAGDRED